MIYLLRRKSVLTYFNKYLLKRFNFKQLLIPNLDYQLKIIFTMFKILKSLKVNSLSKNYLINFPQLNKFKKFLKKSIFLKF
jgi:hypothetical protein